MTKTLTEQWRDGTLPDGFYYMQDYNGRHQYRYLLGVKPDADFVKCFKEVLAPVPRYNEYKRLQERLEIATNALKRYEDKQNWDIRGVAFMKYNKGFTIARKALKEMEGVK